MSIKLGETRSGGSRFARRMALATVFAGICMGWGMSNASQAEEAKPKAGDRIVFLGDSITQAGAGPNGYVTMVREALKGDGVEVLGAGISGNKVPDLEARLDRDVIEKKPTLVVIYIGINDVWHWANGRGTKKEDFDAGLRRVIGKIKQAGARVILCTASVIGEKTDGSNSQDKLLDEYCEVSRVVAKETDSQLLDLRKLFLDHLKKTNKSNADKNVLTTDGVHLNAAGNRFVADAALSALGVPHAGGKLRHVVLFKFKPEVTQEQADEVVTAFAALPGKIDTIIEFESGTDVSIEGKSEGLTHGFVVTFANEKGREIYLPHPAHQEFVKLVGPRLEKVVVFDYWTR